MQFRKVIFVYVVH